MSLIHIVILAVIQGMAELLPVSSSAHVIAAAKLLHEDPSSPHFTWLLVMLHTGTMFAVIVYFWRAWKRTFFHSETEFVRFSTKIIIATALTGVIGYGLKKGIEKYLDPGFTALDSQGLIDRQPHHPLPTAQTHLTDLVAASAPEMSLFKVGGTLTLTANKGGEDLPYKTFKVSADTSVADLMEFLRKGLGITSARPARAGASPAGVAFTVDPESHEAMVIEITGNQGKDNQLKFSDSSFIGANQETVLEFSDANKAEIEQLFKRLDLLAIALGAAGVLILIAGIASSLQRKSPRKGITTGDSVAIGAVQGLCLPFRGFSRSGATISVGLLRGVSRVRVEEFSFALAVVLTPVAVGYEALRLIKHQHGVKLHDFLPGIQGMGFSFLAGLVGLALLSKLLEKGQWWLFGVYCLAAAGGVYWMHLHGYGS